MSKLRIDWNSCPADLVAGLRAIEQDRKGVFSQAERGPAVRFVPAPASERPGFSITYKGRSPTVHYSRKCDAFRALGRVVGQAQMGMPPQDVSQSCHFDWLALMADYSRNGVPTPETTRTMLCQLALLGFNGFLPYMEDIYEIPGEPFFGYLRGRYTQQELKALDDYAHDLGIEVCINMQALGHLSQMLQWPAYADLRDQPGVLLADYEPTYVFLEKAIVAATAPFRSRRFFPGLDEAHGLGSGRYRRKFGIKDSFQIFSDHTRRICDISNRLGLRPVIAGDMYFRLGSKDNWYYDEAAVIPPEVIQAIPPELTLMYWDYYHTDVEFYKNWIDRHRAMGKEPMMCGGVWTWSHFWAQLPFSMNATDAMMAGCRDRNLREVMCCLWGDDGMQCDPFSALPGVVHFAEHAYSAAIDPTGMCAQLRGAADIDFDDFVRASDIDLRTNAEYMKQLPDNTTTWLLWDDPFLGLLQPQNENPGLAAHHRQLAEDLHKAAAKPGLAKRLGFPEQIARVLSLKVDLHPKLAAALRTGDKATLGSLLTHQLAPLQKEVNKLWKIHRDMWLATYRPFGLEVIEGRYGALRARLQSLADRLKDYLAGKITSIPELEATLLKIFPEDDIYSMIYYKRAATAGVTR